MQTPPEQINLNSILLIIIGTALAFVVGLWMRSSGVKNQRIEDLEAAVNKLQLDAAVTDTKITPLWAKIQKHMSDELHHPHEDDQEADKLIDKLENLEATPTETARLKELFQQRATSLDPRITPRERSIAKIMPIIMDLVLEEANFEETPTEVEAVAVPIIQSKVQLRDGK